MSPDELGFECLEEGFDHRIVVAASLAAHRKLEHITPKQFLVIM